MSFYKTWLIVLPPRAAGAKAGWAACNPFSNELGQWVRATTTEKQRCFANANSLWRCNHQDCLKGNKKPLHAAPRSIFFLSQLRGISFLIKTTQTLQQWQVAAWTNHMHPHSPYFLTPSWQSQRDTWVCGPVGSKSLLEAWSPHHSGIGVHGVNAGWCSNNQTQGRAEGQTCSRKILRHQLYIS